MEEKTDNYISLQEAIKYCNYSQEYLSLRARQGKLKAIKFGRNWVTKKEWLDEYLENVDNYNNSHINTNKKVNATKISLPPKNLPITARSTNFGFQLRTSFVLALVVSLLAGGLVFGKTSFQNAYKDTSPLVYEISRVGDTIIEGIGESFIQSFSNVGSQIGGIGGIFGDYGRWISQKGSDLFKKLPSLKILE